jgi:hypothetical protein
MAAGGGGLGAFAAVGLAWLVAASRAPLGARPWPIGSTDGSVWNVVFGFNGIDRLNATASPAALKLDPPGPLRLFGTVGHDYASLIGVSLLAALVFGGLALVCARWSKPRRLERPTALFLAVWLIVGVALLSHMQRPQPRYLEAFTPALAAVFGAGVGRLARGGRPSWAALAAGAAVLALAGPRLVGHAPAWAVALACAGAATALLAAIARRPSLAAAGAVVAALSRPGTTSLAVAGSTHSDAGFAAPLPLPVVPKLSAYLIAHQGSARYEVASSSAFKTSPLIVRDGRPVVLLTSYQGRPLLTPQQLARLVAARRVRYVMVGHARCTTPGSLACVPVVRWASAHSVDISRALGLPHGTLSRFIR